MKVTGASNDPHSPLHIILVYTVYIIDKHQFKKALATSRRVFQKDLARPQKLLTTGKNYFVMWFQFVI
jgi:hypothetical protein